MLIHLSVRDVVLIDRLDLELGNGLSVFTGETGAGKSILLGALKLALGRRADTNLIRKGAERAVVTATFRLSPGHQIIPLLEKMGIEAEEEMVIRRTINTEGRSRAFVNDQPVTVGYLSLLGSSLVEVHGQNDRLGLLDQEVHRKVVDVAGEHKGLCGEVKTAYHEWLGAKSAARIVREEAETSQNLEAVIREDLLELNTVCPEIGEEARLSELRTLLKESSTIAEALISVRLLLSEGQGDAIDIRIGSARRAIEGVAEAAAGHLDGLRQSLERVSIELVETMDILEVVEAKLQSDPRQLSEVEERLYLLRRIAGKHQVKVDDLESLGEGLASRLQQIESMETKAEEADKVVKEFRIQLSELIERLHDSRKVVGSRLDKGVAKEVGALRMEGVKFCTSIKKLPQDEWTENGGDQVRFEVSTVAGTPLGPIHKIASGGELSRFMLALRVVIAASEESKTLVFDEVDTGIGGAVADSVGQRLGRLSDDMQVLVVTHQPQIAARATHHYKVARGMKEGNAFTGIKRLTSGECIEEVARMLAGEAVTDEARAAARRLRTEAE